MKMRGMAGALVAAFALLASGGVVAAEHVVAPEVAAARLDEARDARAQDVAAVEAMLGTPEAAAVAAALGTSVDAARAGVARLSDSEVADLAARAAALQSDPVAGAMTTRQYVYIGAAILAAIIIIAVVA